ALLTPVLKRPAVAAVLASGILAVLAVPTLQIHTANAGSKALPRSAPTVETLDRIQAAFPGKSSPAVVAVKTDTSSPAFHTAVGQLEARATASRLGYGTVHVDTNGTHTAAQVSVPLPGSGTDGKS